MSQFLKGQLKTTKTILYHRSIGVPSSSWHSNHFSTHPTATKTSTKQRNMSLKKQNKRRQFTRLDWQSDQPTKANDAPLSRKWMSKTQTEVTETFSVTSYNLLAPSLIEAHPELYRGISKSDINWTARLARICERLKQNNSEIICLQEIEERDCEELENRLRAHGMAYNVSYCKRTDTGLYDGCALLVSDRFEILSTQKVAFNKVSADYRFNVCITALLKCAKTQKQVLVATTHLLWNPRRGDIKVCQLNVIFGVIQGLLKDCPQTPIILAGDFNLLPSSLIYRYLVEGFIQPHLASGTESLWSGQIDTPRGLSLEDKGAKKINHPFKLKSAYHPHTHPNGRPFVSTHHDAAETLVDYILFGAMNGSPECLACTRVLCPPTQTTKMPNRYDPSDHHFLLAEFGFINESQQSAPKFLLSDFPALK
jgi:mRNA deadenylase 3'-5' endonuclease subunit Ccr4